MEVEEEVEVEDLVGVVLEEIQEYMISLPVEGVEEAM